MRYRIMELQINDGLIRVVILCIEGLYSQIYDELYCTKEKYEQLLSEFGGSDKYRVVKL